MQQFLSISLALIAICHCQRTAPLNRFRNFYDPYRTSDYYGRYRDDSGRYYPDDSGRYIPDGSGRYVGIVDRYRYTDGIGRVSGDALIKLRPVQVGPNSVSVIRKSPQIGVRSNERNAAILRFEKDQFEDGYHYLYQTENGITGEEQGRLENIGSDGEALKATGSFSYTGPDNNLYTVEYTADDKGFVARGAHLPGSLQKATRFSSANRV